MKIALLVLFAALSTLPRVVSVDLIASLTA